MAFNKCPECNHDVSSAAKTCPHCGYPLSAMDSNHTSGLISKQNEEKKNVLIAGAGYPFHSISVQIVDMISDMMARQ